MVALYSYHDSALKRIHVSRSDYADSLKKLLLMVMYYLT